ncbi:FCD domain-containing protein [Arthrobacter sp. ISL-48]|uniref:FCD domain-containing protein n=1 Tax=Arthrobacter sp. ISL-48 TaxID=2819110 RepID=UPI001BEAD4BF|nr:FCD domain-containing protein [Arthrobacter sp. ISL-48]MBT2533346.1 FCD domain-containing protein [Arthrobacter sp. ISL-48]
MTTSTAERDVRQDLVAHDSRFHALILSGAGNPVIGQAYAQTHCHLHIFRLYPKDIDSAGTVAEHRTIAEAIANADPESAEKAMSDHIKNSFKRFARAFEAGARSAPLAGLTSLPLRLAA